MAEVESHLSGANPNGNHQIKSKFLRQIRGIDKPENYQYKQKKPQTEKSKHPNPSKVGLYKSASTSKHVCLKNTKKPARFNEELEASATQSIAMSEYLNQTQKQDGRDGSRKIRVNLRSINNAAERDQFKQMQKHRSNVMPVRPQTSHRGHS